jgi:hypothetical protein
MLSIFPFIFIGSEHPYRSSINVSESHSQLSRIFNWEMLNGRFHYYHRWFLQYIQLSMVFVAL